MRGKDPIFVKTRLIVIAVVTATISLGIGVPANADWLWYPYAQEVTRSRSYSSGHRAIDFAASCGTAIYAAAAGRVTQVVASNSCRRCYDCYSGCGSAYVDGPCFNNQIYIAHSNGYSTRYLHVQSSDVSEGNQVEAGQRIGVTGNVGWTCGNTGCHLHFELRNSGNDAVQPGRGHWTQPLRYGNSGPPPDDESPRCEFPRHPGVGEILGDGSARVEWRVSDSGSHLRGASQSWNEPIARGGSHSSTLTVGSLLTVTSDWIGRAWEVTPRTSVLGIAKGTPARPILARSGTTQCRSSEASSLRAR